MKKFKVIQATVATAMAVSMFSFTACDLLGGGSQTGDGKTYEVTLNVDDGDLMMDLSSYVSGETTPLPNAQKEHYTFGGWYTNAQLTGDEVISIPKSSKGNVQYWAKWTPETYSIKYYVDGVAYTDSTAATSYTYNEVTTLPALTKNNYSFDGWYENSNYNGTSVTTVAKGEYGNKEYYAKWNADSYKVTLELNGGKFTAAQGNGVTGYTYGNAVTLPEPSKQDHKFDGWFEKADFSGNKVTAISATDTGNKTYYAKWTLTAAIQIKDSGGYEEGAYIEVYTDKNVTKDKIKITCIPMDGSMSTITVDKQLIREYTAADDKKYLRADIVGLVGHGDSAVYNLKVEVDGNWVQRSVTATAYDRSGYAHFKTTEGVGGYNNDGTPKKNAKIIYVTEETKNTVTATFDQTYTGIGNILTNVNKSSTPVIIRIIGRVAAATWNEIKYTKTDSNTDSKGNLLETAIKGKNGTQLPKNSSTTQADLIAGNYNTLNTTEYPELLGLSSKITYKSGAYDSCWNDCSISGGAENVTVEGIGTDAEIFQWGMTWKSANSIEVRNLTFDDYTEDACSFEGSTDTTNTGKTPDKFNSKNLWVHHCVFNEGKNYWDVSDEQDKHEGDGATDFKRCSYVTTSYNYYYKNHKTGLVGSDDNVYTSSITFHHNYYKQCVSRLPLARVANMHMYNNYYHGSTGTNMSLRAGAYAFIEYCYFDNANNPITTETGKADKLLDGYSSPLNGCAKVYECTFVGKQVDSKYNVTKVTNRTTAVTNDNIYAQDFDTNATYFYYDSTKQCSKVTDLITDLTLVKSEIPKLAGVLTSERYLKAEN